MDLVEVQPKSYPPSSLLAKDWTQRKCLTFKDRPLLLERIHDMEIQHDDVWLDTPPKCGTTWMQELLWLVMHDYDFESAKNVDLELRAPFLEFEISITGDVETALKPVEDLKPPRLIKSHLPLPLLPAQLWTKKPKTVFVFRNPKDSIISLYYHKRSLGLFKDKSLTEHIDEFIKLNSEVPCMHFEQVTEFYSLRNEPWLFYTSFERMKLNLREVIDDVCKFLNKTINATQMQQMLHHLSFEQMKDNPKTNHIWEFERVRRKLNTDACEKHNFVRKGKMDGYKEELSVETIAKLDAWLEEQLAYYKLKLPDLLLLQDSGDN